MSKSEIKRINVQRGKPMMEGVEDIIEEAKDCLLGHNLGFIGEPEWSRKTARLVSDLLVKIEQLEQPKSESK